LAALTALIMLFVLGSVSGADSAVDCLNPGLLTIPCSRESCAPSVWDLTLLVLFSESSWKWNPVHSTDEAAYAVDHQGVIVAWNLAAERLFGYATSTAVGRHCWDLLGGHDIFDNRYCAKDCPIREMACRREPIHGSRLLLRMSSGGSRLFDVTILETSGHADGPMLIHVCRPAAEVGTAHHEKGFTPSPNRQRGGLTPRETELLRLLAEGKATRDIASDMCISPITVRNHVQRILYKLRVHTRLEAVAKARRLRLI
jgi:PAS domain S-box-containing protein